MGSRRQDLQVVAAFYGSLTIQLTARREWLEKSGISPTSTIDDKVRALKGRAYRLLVARRRAAAIHPISRQPLWPRSREGHPITSVGQGPPRIAALREGRVDMVVGGAPEADQVSLDGYGELFINFSEIPIFQAVPVHGCGGEGGARRQGSRARAAGGAHHRQGERLHPPQLRRGGRGAAGAVSAGSIRRPSERAMERDRDAVPRRRAHDRGDVVQRLQVRGCHEVDQGHAAARRRASSGPTSSWR